MTPRRQSPSAASENSELLSPSITGSADVSLHSGCPDVFFARNVRALHRAQRRHRRRVFGPFYELAIALAATQENPHAWLNQLEADAKQCAVEIAKERKT